MNLLTFKGIRFVGPSYVAVFDDFNREFLLDQPSLEMRIANLERNYDVTIERTALAALRRYILAGEPRCQHESSPDDGTRPVGEHAGVPAAYPTTNIEPT